MLFQTETPIAGPFTGKLTVLGLSASLLLALFPITGPSRAEPVPAADAAAGQAFACGDAGRMRARFVTENDAFVAIVTWPGEAPRSLALMPSTGIAQVAWSDGMRTLTWDPGVHLTWRDSARAEPVACSREGGHRHGSAPRPAGSGHEHHKPAAT